MGFTAHCVCVTASSGAQHSLARTARGHAALCPPGDNAPAATALAPPLPAPTARQPGREHRAWGFRGGKALLEQLTPRQTPTQASSPKGTGPHPRTQPGHPTDAPRSSPLPASTQLLGARRSLSTLPGARFIPTDAPQPLCGARRGDPGAGAAPHPFPLGQSPCRAWLPSPEEPSGTGVSAEPLHPGERGQPGAAPAAAGERQLHRGCRGARPRTAAAL